MKFVIQRVLEAKCQVEEKTTGEISQGFCVFIGVSESDTKEIADKMNISRSYVSRIEKKAIGKLFKKLNEE